MFIINETGGHGKQTMMHAFLVNHQDHDVLRFLIQ